MKRVMDVIHNALFGVAWDRRGGVATFLAAMIIPLVAFTGLAVDTARGYLMKSRLSYALDAAALAGGREMADAAKRDAAIDKFFKANFPDGYMGATINGPYVIVDDAAKTIQIDATANMDTSLMRVLGVDTMAVAANTEVKLSSRNIEVSVVLDITLSMSGQKIADLKDAATDLVNIVVQDQQTPHYSKVALVPYSIGVNVGSYADQVRGPIPAAKNITAATKANPAKITAVGHGFSDGDKIYITNVNGMTQLNNKFYIVANATANDFTLRNEDNSNTINSSSYSSYSSGGKIWCTVSGCEYFRFTDSDGDLRTLRPSTCVSERIGTEAEAYTDAPPSTAYVGLNYAGTSYPCPTNEIVPLSADKTLLVNQIAALSVTGSTAGHIGTAWGWYLLSPKFAYLWPSESQKPADYDAPEMLKVAIIMTDGAFNIFYAKGVVAANSPFPASSTSGAPKINQNGENDADAFAQAAALCNAMKAEPSNIEVYTIGFQVGDLDEAKNFLSNCATDAAHYYLAADGDELKTVFKTIAMNISRLRLSK